MQNDIKDRPVVDGEEKAQDSKIKLTATALKAINHWKEEEKKKAEQQNGNEKASNLEKDIDEIFDDEPEDDEEELLDSDYQWDADEKDQAEQSNTYEVGFTSRLVSDLAGMVELAGNNLSNKEKEDIKNNLYVIEETEANTMGALMQKGQLTKEDLFYCDKMKEIGLRPENYTKDEIKKTVEYHLDLNGEATNDKLDHISGMLLGCLQSIRKNNGSYDAKMLNQLDELHILSEKCSKWMKGDYGNTLEVDGITASECMGLDPATPETFYRFDIEKAVKRAKKYGKNEEEVRSRIEFADFDELVDLDYIREDDLLVMGPFTRDDVDYIEDIASRRWISATNQREMGGKYVEGHSLTETENGIVDRVEYSYGAYNTSLATLSNEGRRSRDVSKVGLCGDLTRNFIANNIEPNHRLTNKNLVNLALALANVSSEIKRRPQMEVEDERKYRLIRRAGGWLRHYVAEAVLGMSHNDMREAFGSTVPTKQKNVEAFNKIIEEELKKTSPEHMEELNKIQGVSGEFTKLDETCSRINSLIKAYEQKEKQAAIEDQMD